MSRLRRGGAWLALAPALWLGLGPGLAAAEPAVAVRPTGPHLTREMLETFAGFVPPTRLSPDRYPEAGRFTPQEIVEVLCGRASPDYLALLKQRNGLSDADLRRPAGERAYQIDFIHCPYVAKFETPKVYVAESGDTYAQIREAFTGVQGTPASNAKFFGVPEGVIRSGRLRPGDELRIPYATAASILPADEASALSENLKPASGRLVANYVQFGPSTAGRIVTYVGDSGVDAVPEKPAECGPDPVRPFDAAAVVAAYEFAVKRAAALNQRVEHPVDVMVADNGFFGARPRPAGGYDFRTPEFDGRHFDTATYGRRLGPVLEDPQGQQTYPVNYQNGLSPAGPLSGHGTHVTGLVLGGTEFLPHRSRVYGPGVGWLKLTQLNVGRGSATLMAGSQRELSSQLLLLQGSRIVNLSLTYDGRASGIPASFTFLDEASDMKGVGRHLFVVAAGNDRRGNAADYQPAARGGIGVAASVITVAATDPAGRLTSFTNIGSTNVDVAAPGCNLESWTSDAGPAVALSGTSQAAPLVTFQASLIRSLTGADPADLKIRIVSSGDLLHPDDARKVSGHTRIDIPRSLYVFDDYVRWKAGAGERAVLGRVVKASGLVCRDDDLKVDLAELRAFKQDPAQAYAFRRPSAQNRLAVCAVATPGAADVLVVEPSVEATGDHPASPESLPGAPGRYITIPMRDVIDVTMRMKDAG